VRRLVIAIVVGVIAAVGAAAAATASAAAAAATDPMHDSLIYCDEGLDHGATGAVTDAEHTIVVGDLPLPPNVHRFRMTVDGISTPVMEAGPPDATEAVVFIHGNPGSSRDFDQLVSATGQFARAVAFDMPGLGHADDRSGGPYTTDGAAHFIDGMLAQLGITQADMVLHDFGGPWGLQWATQHPDRLKSVVLIDTGVLIGYVGHPAALEWHTPIVGELNMATTTRQTFDASLQAQNPKLLPWDFVNRMYDDYDRSTRCADLHYYRDISNPDALGRSQAAVLSKRPRPALVVWGQEDPYVPFTLAQTQKQAFPGADVHIVQDAGHWPFVDQAQTVQGLVIPFLRKVTAGP
jgi:pimeloyl-ACP methyl ester carboxylesterase